MACNMTTGYNDRTCTNGKGGIKSVMLFPLGNVSASTIVDNEITALTVTGEVFLYKLKSNLSSYTAPIRVNKGNGTLWYEQTLTMILASDTKEALDTYKKQYSQYWNAILSGTGELELNEVDSEDILD